MQCRGFLWLLVTALLYFAPSGISTSPALAMGWQLPQQFRSPDTGPPAEQAEDPPTAIIEERNLFLQPHIGVILPLQSRPYARLAEQVRLGILTASNMASYTALPVTVYPTDADQENILEAYNQAIDSGARAIIGPLTRDGVSALAERAAITVSTVVLNVPDANILLPQGLYVFGLQIESEAEQVAELAFSQGGRKALLVTADTPLGRRIANAFAQKWQALRGDIADEFVYSTDAKALTGLRELIANTAADVAFLALDAPSARFIRTYLGTQFPIYATSLVYASNADRLQLYDLDGVRFVDMPWLLQEDHPAVMTYLRNQMESSALDEERFFAMGIDAYRIAEALVDEPAFAPRIDGVTGAISLEREHFFRHRLTPAFFSYGRARLLVEETLPEQ
jgi:outer membrane PBP1 activator LpoA protein